MKVLLVASYPPSLRNFRGSLILELRARGHCVSVAAPNWLYYPQIREWLEVQGVPCHEIQMSRTSLNPFSDVCAMLELISLMRRLSIDVFLGYTAKPVIWGLMAARVAGVTRRVALITGLGYAFTSDFNLWRLPIKCLMRFLYAIALRCSNIIFFQNSDDRILFQEMGLIPSGRSVHVVPGSGVDLDYFSPKDLPVADDSFSFLLVARLLVDKGIREFVAAARMVKKRYPGVSFHLVGPIDSNPAGISLAEVRSWHDSGFLTWHGRLDDVREIMASSCTYVLPSYREGLPRTVLEAMAIGRPVITTDVPGCRETVIDGFNGLLVPPRSASALAGAMIKILNQSNDKTFAMAQASLELVRDRFDVQKVNSQIIAAMDL